MPMHVVADDLAKKRLVRLHIEEAGSPTFEASLFAIHRTAEPPGPAARWLIDRLGEACTPKKKKAAEDAELGGQPRESSSRGPRVSAP